MAKIIATLNNDGIDGDVVAGDNIFTAAGSFTQYPVGTVELRISAAFSGSLVRTQTGPFQLEIEPAADLSGWTTLMDSQRLFSIKAPATWGLVLDETPGDDPGTLKNVDFEFPDGTIVFRISVNTISSWDAMQSGYSQGPVPVFLSRNNQYVFGQAGTQVPIIGEPISAEELSKTLPQVLATFNVL
jgi:hypothetical protein